MNNMNENANTKSQLGQFFTTNYEYILQGLNIPKDIMHVIEPFAGNGDLLSFIEDKDLYTIECYDIDPKKEFVQQRDTLNDPPDYEGKFVLSNPPYLALNKTNDKEVFAKYGVNDLYKCFLVNLLTNKCAGGILIIPLNFWCSIRKMDVDLRKRFLQVYSIQQLNIFEERVFDDTSYTVCSFQFSILKEKDANKEIPITIYPAKKLITASLNPNNNYMIGGEIYVLNPQNTYKITRLIKGQEPNTNILAKCIDDNSSSKIGLKMVPDEEIYFDETPNKTARTYATLVITPAITMDKQVALVQEFNNYFNKHRERYHSLFLTNYRESKGEMARKRISFELIYDIVGHLLMQ